MGLVLERQVHVADPLLRERGRGGPGAGVEDGRPLVELGDERLRIRLAAAAGQHGSPGGEKAVLSVAGRLGIGRDDRHVPLDQVVPILDSLRVPLANDEHHDRVVGNRVVVEPPLPVGLDEPGLGDRLDVGPDRQRDDVGFEAVDHGTRLAARRGVRLLDRDLPAMLRTVPLREGRIDVAVEFPGRVVRDVEEFERSLGRRSSSLRFVPRGSARRDGRGRATSGNRQRDDHRKQEPDNSWHDAHPSLHRVRGKVARGLQQPSCVPPSRTPSRNWHAGPEFAYGGRHI